MIGSGQQKRGLQQSSRQRIAETIARNPGITKSELTGKLDLAWGTVSYQVDHLVHEGTICLLRDRGRVRTFAEGVPDHQKPWYGALRDPFSREIVSRLIEQGRLQAFELADSLGASRRVIRRHLDHLHDAGVIERQGSAFPRYVIADSCLPFVKRAIQG